MHKGVAFSLLASCALASVAAQAAEKVAFPDRVCNVTRYGAEGHRLQIALNTESFQKAIDECAAAGGGTVLVPAGNYLVEPLFLKSNVRLHLEKNATLVASTGENAYRATDSTRYAEAENGWLPFISIADAQNVAITGEGTIDGQGAVWWERWRAAIRATGKKGGTDRPRLIYVTRSSQVLIDGVTLTNSPSFHVVMRYAHDVTVNGTNIIAPWHAPNTDAIDPIDSQNIRITNNVIDCNDDHIAIKAEKPDSRFPNGVVDNIYIANNVLKQGRGISIGSETSGGVNNVLVENNRFEGSMYGIRIKSLRGKGGEVKNVTYRHTRMVDVEVPLVFSGYYQAAPIVQAEVDKLLQAGGFTLGEQIYPPDTEPAQPFDKVKTPHFSQVTIVDLESTGRSKAAGYIIGVPEAPLSGFHFEQVRIDAEKGLRVRNAELATKGLTLNVKQGDALLLDKGANVTR
ncbi:glycoside hydrolase family 28 protein [Dickeya fangzhongdai]|uniref:Exo-poly-alpha-D-galacturonosidase n=1 Tax=Dickeya fangzhongdai TaxID=1778540 RepID=A0A2K8QJD1_9GAMM|nr:glycoside hydrolase family 28 protein [Dickeya fangzhongdai]AIR68876.1 exo-poly-alpha-D-galacturonosidase [Dickeya fangzhongdai]ATZ93609.1 exo-poly-alpha-D-galacturonosidase [Dickeya fangzhongdai]AYH47252.1 exo-poly-alpha-D-galacturonosidase [Dickeya fangzhongdai]KGT99562.1 exo-poly-alpha-D-galacturonosidase [Dickeya fangzhongdai]MBO8133700.1 glycoside hydrolase family 28 protein [Dickeya fangzhongdai]